MPKLRVVLSDWKLHFSYRCIYFSYTELLLHAVENYRHSGPYVIVNTPLSGLYVIMHECISTPYSPGSGVLINWFVSLRLLCRYCLVLETASCAFL